MALNPGKVGATYPTYAYRVTREKIHEYAVAVGEDDPAYFGDDCVAPPTFAACFTVAPGVETLLADPDLGAHASLLHGSQSYEYGQRPLRDGDVVECTPRITNITGRGGNEFLTLEIDCRFAGEGAQAVLSRSVVVLLGEPDPEQRS